VTPATRSPAATNSADEPVAISLLMLAAFAGFGYLARRKLAIVAALCPRIASTIPASA